MYALRPLDHEHVNLFKHQMQESFQKGAVDGLGPLDVQVLPESDIDASLSAKGSFAYVATDGPDIVGGTIVVIDTAAGRGELHFLYVDVHHQNSGVGRFIWNAIEERHPEVTVWETHTPYFDQRNIHFYINVCGFNAVEFFNVKHQGHHMNDDIDSVRGTDCMFRFEKMMKR